MGLAAAIDIGTVSVRLALAEVSDGHVDHLAKQTRICDLGEGVDKTGFLAPGAIERVSSCSADFVAAAREAGAERACCTLTSAARDASNSSDLLGRLRGLGLSPEVIPGEVEGSLTFLGVAQDFRGERICVADNGGGSTELAVGRLARAGEEGDPLEIEYVRSANVGCRRVTEHALSQADPPTADDLAQAHAFCRERLGADVPWSEAAAGDGAVERPGRLCVVGGTVTSLVAMREQLDPYDSHKVHLATLSCEDVDALERMLASLTAEERRHVIGLQPKRAPVILGGAIAIRELLRVTGFGELTVSESDLLFGLALAVSAAESGRSIVGGWKPGLSRL